jgi:pimeloyl-ACP methyl ester carboxylesterase
MRLTFALTTGIPPVAAETLPARAVVPSGLEAPLPSSALVRGTPRERAGLLHAISDWAGRQSSAVSASLLGAAAGLGRLLGRAQPVGYVAPSSFVPADYRASIARYMVAEQDEIAASGRTQKAANHSFARFHEGPAPRGVALLLHGFNAGPEQWRPLAEDLFANGYDIFVPSLPGHGLLKADGTEDASQLPTIAASGAWAGFEDRVLDAARGAGKITVVGLSVGGLLALHLAERHADDPGASGAAPLIDKVVSIAPYDELAGNYQVAGHELKLGPLGLRNQVVAEILTHAEHVFGAPIDRFLAKQRVDRQGAHPAINYGSRFVGYDNVLALESTANETEAGAARLQKIPGGVHVLVTASDDLVDPAASIALAQSAGAEIHVFPKSQRVPHSMIHPLENTDPQAYAEAKAQILSRL